MSMFFLAYLGLHIVDWKQTLHGPVNHPDRYVERNVIEGRHPSRGTVNTYMLASLAGVYYLDTHLTGIQRDLFMTGALSVEIYAVSHNFGANIGLRF